MQTLETLRFMCDLGILGPWLCRHKLRGEGSGRRWGVGGVAAGARFRPYLQHHL